MRKTDGQPFNMDFVRGGPAANDGLIGGIFWTQLQIVRMEIKPL